MKIVTRGLLAAAVLLGSAQSTAAQTAGDIIERRRAAALGGRAALETVTSPRAFLGDEQSGMSVRLVDQEKVGAEAPHVEDRAPRGPFDYRHVVPLIAVSMFLVCGVIIAVVITWFEHRSRVKALGLTCAFIGAWRETVFRLRFLREIRCCQGGPTT